MRRKRYLGAAFALVLVVAACSGAGSEATTTTGGEAASTTSAEGAQSGDDLLIIGVFHQSTETPFSSRITNGVRMAERDMAEYGVSVEFTGPPEFDIAGMVDLIDAAIARSPDGLFVTLPDPDAIGPKIQEAVEQGIAVVTYNSGAAVFREYGSLAHVGQQEVAAGRVFGERLAAAGARNVICINQQVGNVSLDERCQGMTEALEEAGGTVEVLATDSRDPDLTENAIRAAFQADPSIDGIGGGFAGGPEALLVPVILEELGLSDQVTVGFFDVAEDGLAGIEDGNIDFLASQQQFLQGYYPVVLLSQYLALGLIPGGATGVIQTGPLFIDQSNVDVVIRGREENVH